MRQGLQGHLTGREHVILELVAEFRTNAEIAEALVVSVRTVESHVAHILRKLDCADRREAARRYRELLG